MRMNALTNDKCMEESAFGMAIDITCLYYSPLVHIKIPL